MKIHVNHAGSLGKKACSRCWNWHLSQDDPMMVCDRCKGALNTWFEDQKFSAWLGYGERTKAHGDTERFLAVSIRDGAVTFMDGCFGLWSSTFEDLGLDHIDEISISGSGLIIEINDLKFHSADLVAKR